MISNLLGIYLDIFKHCRYVNSNTGLAVTKTLSLLDTKGFSSSAELKQNLEKILAEFGIQTANIVAIVTDNAANMIKMTEDINDEAIGVNNEVHNNDQDAEIKNDIEETERLERRIIEAIKRLPEISTIRCAQHVLKLVLNNEILNENKPLMSTIRKVVQGIHLLKLI